MLRKNQFIARAAACCCGPIDVIEGLLPARRWRRGEARLQQLAHQSAQRFRRRFVGQRGGVDLGPVAQHGAEEVVGTGRELDRDALGARRLQRGAEQQLVHDQPGTLCQQLERGVGVRHARRPVVGKQQRAHHRSLVATRPRELGAACEQPGELARRGVHEHDLGTRRSIGDGLQEGRGRAARVDVADRQPARGEVRDLQRQGLDRIGQIHQCQLGRRARALGRIDDERVQLVFGEGRAQPLEHHAAEGDMRVRHHRHELDALAGEQAAQAVGLVQRHGLGIEVAHRRR
jgi:hypothetical protein